MRDYLVFRLYGPMASWGEIAVGENRHSFSYPSKSAIMGLVSSALGYKREEEEKHISLTKSLSFGVKVYNSGILLRDYHTVQVPPNKGKIIYSTRKDELREKLDLNTILSSRDYRMDAMYDVCIWKKNDKIDLVDIQNKLNEPVFPLFLGRKSCVIGSPLFASLIIENDLFSAFSKYTQELDLKFKDAKVDNFFDNKKLNSNFIEYIWEGESKEIATEIRTRRDDVLSRKRWQFSEREEFLKGKPQILNLNLDNFIEEDRSFRFSLKANPTKKIKNYRLLFREELKNFPELETMDTQAKYLEGKEKLAKLVETVSKEQREKLPSKRIGIYKDHEQVEWLKRKGEQSGFEILKLQFDKGEKEKVSKKSDGIVTHNLDLLQVHFIGILRVTNVNDFKRAYSNGIGSGKAFGCGMVLLARV